LKQIYGEEKSWESWKPNHLSGEQPLSVPATQITIAPEDTTTSVRIAGEDDLNLNLDEIKVKYSDEIKFQTWLQYLCDKQLGEVSSS